MGQKIAFGLGMLANQMFPAILGIFMVVLVQDLGFPGWMWGFIFFMPRVFDAITDPIMGYISDNTKSKWGRRRQYVFIGGIIMGIAFIFMWQLYKDNTLQYNFWYFFLWSIVFYLGLTIFSVPYVAMGYEMTNDFHERTNIMAVAQWIGQWAWVIAPWFWIIMYDPNWWPSAEIATRNLAYWVGIPCALCAIIPAIFIKSESSLSKDYPPLSLSSIGSSVKQIFQGFTEAFKLKPFRKLCIATFLIFNAFNTVAALTFFVIVYKLFNGDADATGIWVALFGSVGALGTTFIVIPVITKMSKWWGKRKAFIVAQSISIVGYTMLFFLFIPGKPWMYMIGLPFFSFGIGSLFTIMMSMTADVIDLDELKSGKRREGLFGAIYWWMVKVGFAIAGGLSGLIITIVGFNPDLTTLDQQSAVDGLHAFFCFFPMLGTIFAIFVMRDYDVTEKRANEIRAELDRRKIKYEFSGYEARGKLMSLLGSDSLSGTQYSLSKSLGESEHNIRSLVRNKIKHGLHGLCFSPYIEGQEVSDPLTKEQISHRLNIISPYTNWIRSFSCTLGNENIPVIAHEKNIKTLVGAWLSKDKERNDKEINNLIELAQSGYVDIAAVGNEVLLRGDISEAELLEYIHKVKSEVPNLPIGYVDTYYIYYQHPALIDACDILLINLYPFWEGSEINQAAHFLDKMYRLMKEVSKSKKIIVAETGWPSSGQAVEKARPSLINAAKYFLEVQEWAKRNNIDLFYFSSFDESWKVKIEGEVGARWGLWDKDENIKY
jgi:GPH family glycoside/pentoside/hexuronide:cation symporter